MSPVGDEQIPAGIKLLEDIDALDRAGRTLIDPRLFRGAYHYCGNPVSLCKPPCGEAVYAFP